jgi:hypothetical protein
MRNTTSSPSVYFQSTCFGNLPRLLDSLSQADIHCTVLTGMSPRPHLPIESPEMVELSLDAAGYAKFQQVFLGQRCVRLAEYGEHTFWDSRTGLTLHLSVHPAAASPHPTQRRSRHHHDYAID